MLPPIADLAAFLLLMTPLTGDWDAFLLLVVILTADLAAFLLPLMTLLIGDSDVLLLLLTPLLGDSPKSPRDLLVMPSKPSTTQLCDPKSFPDNFQDLRNSRLRNPA